jgi:Flp pilus assembly secretin CpaC
MSVRIHGLMMAAILAFTPVAGARASDDPVTLGVGEAFRLFVEKAFATVIVGDSAVVDVRADDDHSVVVEPLSPGQTNLVFIDGHGRVTTNVRISICGAPPVENCTAGHSS